MKKLPAALALLGVLACGGVSEPPPPVEGVPAAAQRADDALRAAFASGDGGPLQQVLAGPALVRSRRQVAEMARRGARREEVLEARRLVHVQAAGGRAEAVLEIRARQRIQAPGRPPSPAATVLRQWRAALAWESGRWMVVDGGDLPPPQWWPSS